MHEKRVFELINLDARKLIAAETGVPLKRVSQLVSRYEMVKVQHGWLMRAKERGEPLPESNSEVYSWTLVERHSIRVLRARPILDSYHKGCLLAHRMCTIAYRWNGGCNKHLLVHFRNGCGRDKC